jgi:hypothetical protein
MKEIAPCIVVVDNAIDNPEEIIKISSDFDDQWRDSYVGGSGSFVKKEDIRNNKILDFPIEHITDERLVKVFKNLWSYGDEYGKKYNVGFSKMEDVQLLKYEGRENFYKSHSDDGPNTSRVFSSILYLNDVEQGGETYFNNFDLSVTPEAGKIILFPANFAYSHEARGPISGQKFAMVTWFQKISFIL